MLYMKIGDSTQLIYQIVQSKKLFRVDRSIFDIKCIDWVFPAKGSSSVVWKIYSTESGRMESWQTTQRMSSLLWLPSPQPYYEQHPHPSGDGIDGNVAITVGKSLLRNTNSLFARWDPHRKRFPRA